ncbi:MAG: hypothetical protein K2H47_08710 [Muribaculaceae bacterium]|nr:hypothetical protein [Muribaculaceae bacterium]
MLQTYMDMIYDKALRECISRCALKEPEELIEYGFSCGYMTGYNSGYRDSRPVRRINSLRLRVATAAMQGLLAGGYLAEHSDTAAEALRQADALLAKLDIIPEP